MDYNAGVLTIAGGQHSVDGQLNTYTSGCAHPDGVILAGDDVHQEYMNHHFYL